MTIPLEKIDPYRWRIPRRGGMRVDGMIYADDMLIDDIRQDKCLDQVANVAHLPGIVKHSLAMPDIHWGYGFPIGGVAAFDLDDGVVSPGGVGYDINCGVRLLVTSLRREQLVDRVRAFADALFRRIPAGVGGTSSAPKLSRNELMDLMRKGAGWAVQRGVAESRDLDQIEERGCLSSADPSQVSERALERGRKQVGTVGSGNHFIEVQYVEQVYQPEPASRLGLERGVVTVSIHSGSRGLGYQVCDDWLREMLKASARYGIELPDRQLCCAPIGSDEGRRYLGAMAAAANYAFVNRAMMAHHVREALELDLGLAPREHRLRTVYDVCHNIAKIETHEVDGVRRKLCVHRKGATRAFGPGHPSLSPGLRDLGQPVLIPGDMGRYSFVLLGRQGSEEAFGSTCHGAGRRLSRTAAKKSARGRPVVRELADQGITVRAAGMATVLEEIPEAYKDVADVVRAVDGAGLAARLARLRPIAVIKG
ncbi:MAG: RtcB family protein [Acidobacteriota bacterium]|nr:MAG: RtcB family protein [Acidobacteriota bacterium]